MTSEQLAAAANTSSALIITSAYLSAARANSGHFVIKKLVPMQNGVGLNI